MNESFHNMTTKHDVVRS